MEKYAILLNRATKCDRLYCSFTTNNNNNKNGLRQRHTSNDSTISQRVACVCMCVCLCVVVYGGRETLNALRSLTYYMKTVFARSVCCCYIQSHIIHCNATLIFRQMSVAVLLFALSSSMLHVARPTLAKRFIIIIIESERASPWDETEKNANRTRTTAFYLCWLVVFSFFFFFLNLAVVAAFIAHTHTSCAHKSSRAMLTIQYCRVVSADKQDRHTSYYNFCCSNIDEKRESEQKNKVHWQSPAMGSQRQKNCIRT